MTNLLKQTIMTIDLNKLYETIKSDKPNATEAEIQELMQKVIEIWND